MRSARGYTYADSTALRAECSLAQADRQGENGEHASGGCKDTRVQQKAGSGPILTSAIDLGDGSNRGRCTKSTKYSPVRFSLDDF